MSDMTGEAICAKCGQPILAGQPRRWSSKTTEVEYVNVSGWRSLTAGRYAVVTPREPEPYHSDCWTPDA